MKQTVEEAARKYADENCWIPEELHDSEIPDYIEHFAKHFMAGAEWQAKQSSWISVKERLPEESEFVLCRMVSNEAIVSGYIFVSPDGLPCVATLPNFEFDDYGGYVCDMWMPIPKFN